MTTFYNRRRFVQSSVFAAGAVAVGAQAQQPEFREIRPPQNVETGNKIEVLEFFQYSCPHCASFEPALESWRKRLPADVQYRRNPVMFDPRTEPHVRIYYVLEQLNRLDLHNKVFEAFHSQRRTLLKPEEIAEFMAANGIGKQQWLDAYNSFTTVSRVKRANAVWQAYKVDGTPMLAIDGKFATSPSMVGSREGAVAAADRLIERARKERSK